MASCLHHSFDTSQGTPPVICDNAVLPPKDPIAQQQTTETSPPAGNNLFSQQFASQLSYRSDQFMPMATLQ